MRTTFLPSIRSTKSAASFVKFEVVRMTPYWPCCFLQAHVRECLSLGEQERFLGHQLFDLCTVRLRLIGNPLFRRTRSRQAAPGAGRGARSRALVPSLPFQATAWAEALHGGVLPYPPFPATRTLPRVSAREPRTYLRVKETSRPAGKRRGATSKPTLAHPALAFRPRMNC
jgi:hypothetical protein